MPSYLIVNIEIRDPKAYAEYFKIAPESIAKFGGRYLARGGRTEKIEGAWEPRRMVILEFDTYERAKAWWASEEYRGPKALRQSSAVTDMVLVEGT